SSCCALAPRCSACSFSSPCSPRPCSATVRSGRASSTCRSPPGSSLRRGWRRRPVRGAAPPPRSLPAPPPAPPGRFSSPPPPYLGQLLGPLLVTSIGLGLLFVPLTLVALHNVAEQHSGVAASLLNTGQQVGGAIGLATLGTIAWTTVADNLRNARAAIAAGHQ